MSDADATPEIADNEAIYDAQIAPLMSQILDICVAHDIPMVACFEYAADSLCSSFVLPPGAAEKLVQAAHAIKPYPDLMAFTVTSKP